LSNVIKAYSVHYDDVAKITLDSHFRLDEQLLEKRNSVVKIQEIAEAQEGVFVEGLQAIKIETIEQETDTGTIAARLLEDAQNEAKEIIDEAKKEAEKIKNEAHAAAQKKGYEEGIQQTKREAQKLKTDYDEKNKRLQKEYEEMIHSFEPQMAEIIAALVEKITGVLIEDKEDIILFLITRSIRNLDQCDFYTIRVSNEDYEYVSMRKELVLSSIGKNVGLNIIADASLTKNQCLVETDLRIINCSLDVQLGNLITDLKLLSSI